MKKIFIALIALLPLVSWAEPKTLRDVAALVVGYLNVAIYLVIALAIATFVWNVYLYFFTEKDKKEAGLYVMYSVIGFFVILSFWGLVAILRNSLDLNDRAPSFPGFSQTNSSGGRSSWDPYGGDQYGQNPFNTNASNQSPSAQGGVNLPGGTTVKDPNALPGGRTQ